MDSGAQVDSRGLLWNWFSLMTKWLPFLCPPPRCTHRFTMTITSAQRNHGNIELINSRREELLVQIVHAAFSCMKLAEEDLWSFVSDVLGSHEPSDFPCLPRHPYACVCVCTSVDIFLPFPRERTQRESKTSIPTFFAVISHLQRLRCSFPRFTALLFIFSLCPLFCCSPVMMRALEQIRFSEALGAV